MAQLSTSNIDTQKQGDCSCVAAFEALSVCATALNTTQVAINTAQAALQRVTPIPMHALLTALGARVASAEEVRALAAVHAAPDQPMAMDTSAPAVHVSAPSTHSGYPVVVDTLSETSSVWDMSAPSRPPTPEVHFRESTSVPSSQRWYAVTVGRVPGVYQGSDNIVANCSGISGNVAINYPTQEAAVAAYDAALERGEVVQVTLIVTRTALAPA
ncbi:hypothetical protein Hypma_000437 [Hypsizygus marmoreus]|uniref:Ribonuclease H1 N-terminal domain-containing protein n=1 Tax=Hypsizygus marmoreus TaxID=39966 RepID=A0A369JHH8_HYPMA|nr:hypothetical protein Hypma_000437 [Hypsizygus marmoreus]